MSAGKAYWSSESTYLLLQKCVEAVYRKERVGSTFTKKGWANIHRDFNAASNIHYDLQQIKNRVLVLKREWNVWIRLKQETGVGWNPDTGTPEADDDWWTTMKDMKKGYEKFRHKPLEFPSEMACVFEGAMAQGRHQMSQHFVQYDDDVYRPNMGDLQEGSGDSEEDLEPSPTGLSAGLEGIQIPSSQPTQSGSGGKRKRGDGTTRSRRTRGGSFADPAQSALSRIADVFESREERKKGKKKEEEEDIPSATDCLQFLYTLDEIKDDKQFRLKCSNMVECPTIRSRIKFYKEISTTDLIDYLRLCLNDPPEWLKPYI